MKDFLIMILEDICGSDLFASIYSTLSVNLFSATDTYGPVLNMVRTIHESAIKPVAVMLMFIYFMIAVVDKMSSENFTWEQLWRQMAMLLAAKFLIDEGFAIMEILFKIGMLLSEQISGLASINVETSAFDYEQIIEDFEDSIGFSGVFSVIGDAIMFAFLLLPWAFSWVMKLCVSIICYTRVIEIYARATFAPIALSDFFHSGLQGAGWRFLKNFMAVCLQGGMIIIIAAVYSRMFAVVFADISWTNLFSSLGIFIAFYASAIMLMFKSLSLTKELMGTN